jgi:uncharacterized membrane protein
MVAVWSVLVAFLIVTGQSLWKSVADSVSKSHSISSMDGLLAILKYPKLYLGLFVYGLATVAYIILLGKYKYFQVQSVVVGGSILLTIAMSSIVFHEHITTLNSVGLVLILIGVLLVISR